MKFSAGFGSKKIYSTISLEQVMVLETTFGQEPYAKGKTLQVTHFYIIPINYRIWPINWVSLLKEFKTGLSTREVG